MKEYVKEALKKAKGLEKKKIWTKEQLKKDDASFINMAKKLPRLLTGKFAKRKSKKK